MGEERLKQLKLFKNSYVMVICFIFAIQLVISKIKSLMSSIGISMLIAALLMAPIMLLNFLIKQEEKKLSLKKNNILGNDSSKNPKQKLQQGQVFCPECREQISEDSKYCPECGEQVNQE